MEVVIQELIRQTKLSTPEEFAEFHQLRKQAFDVAKRIFDDRTVSYNVDHEPVEEMPYGAVSLASEIFKRAMRMANILTPLRESSLRDDDLARWEDTSLDLINYASWMYALAVMVRTGKCVVETTSIGESVPSFTIR